MVAEPAIYTVVHQPRRLKLPAQSIPRGASIEDIYRCVFDERMDERYFLKVAQYSYHPTVRLLLELVRHEGMHLSIGFSLSFVRQAAKWDLDLLDRFRELVAEEHVELIGVEPYHSFLFLLDLPLFVLRMQEMANELERIFGKRPSVTDTTEMCMSATVYNALDTAGFRGALMDGRSWVLDWRDSGPYLLTRHQNLSDDVGYRFSNRGWSGYPLLAESYAGWIAETWGDFVLLGWDFATFGEHHRRDSGIFDFLRALPNELARRGVATTTPGALIDRFSTAETVHHLPLPVFPTTWAGNGGMEFFLGNSAQQAIMQLMGHVYGMAKLTENPDLLDLAIWLNRSDNLHLIQWFGSSGSEAGVSAYFTPDEWWNLGPRGIIAEQQQVYLNVLHAMEPYLPARLVRRARQHGTIKSNRRKREQEIELELSFMARHI